MFHMVMAAHEMKPMNGASEDREPEILGVTGRGVTMFSSKAPLSLIAVYTALQT
jgi:hypothetical protein